MFFVFQGQGEVANPGILFHSQAEEWGPRAIRDTLPYFLGAVDPDHIIKQQRLRSLKRDLRILRRELDDEVDLVGPTARAAALLGEAVDAGLVERVERPVSQTEALRLLSTAIADTDEPALGLPSEDEYLRLLTEQDDLRKTLGEVQAQRHLLDRVASERSAFEVEANEQVSRLASLDLLPANGDEPSHICPVCTSRLDVPVPAVDDLRDALGALTHDLVAVRSAEPRVQEALGTLEAQERELQSAIRRNALAKRELERSRDAVARFRDESVRRAAIRGRIGLYLDATREHIAASAVAGQVDLLEREIAELEEELGSARVQENLESALSRVNRDMARIAVDLRLEHTDSPVRLDTRRLTVVADTSTGPVPLNNMGSGENWLGYHIAVLLALHDWFTTQERPVPRFLVLDQPSQVYFPPDSSGDEEVPETNEDRAALARVMAELRDAVARNSPNFQIIVLDHADLQEQWFQDAIVERWRGGRALVPAPWLSN